MSVIDISIDERCPNHNVVISFNILLPTYAQSIYCLYDDLTDYDLSEVIYTIPTIFYNKLILTSKSKLALIHHTSRC